jgi:ABC-type phosphate transport system substrate-binding protein
MHRLMPRRLGSACVLSVLAATALAAPSVASAAPGEQCSGANIEGKGASLQKLSQISIWTPNFSTSANALACSGSQGSTGKPTVTYHSTGSGPGLESWGQEDKVEPLNYGPKNAYVGTDEPPNPAQKAEIESHGGGKLLTIPVEQAAVTVAMHLPAGCTLSGGPTLGRIALKEATVEKIFRDGVTTWKQILNGAKMTGTGCNTSTLIKRVVRTEGSGTTSLFKKYLNIVYSKAIPTAGEKTWKQLAESANNTTWPNESGDPVIRGAGNGGMANEVAANAGSIGYVNLADARANGKFTPPLGGANTPTFWAEVENGKITVEGKKVSTYSDPSSNGDVAAKASSNCEETLYTNGKKRFPPPAASEAWNEVSTSKTEKNYVICGFTYDLGLTHFSGVTGSTEAPTVGSVTTAFDYLNFVLATGAGGGQTLIGENQDYLGLPTSEEASKNVLKIAREGQAQINF